METVKGAKIGKGGGKRGRLLHGLVVSDKMKDTVVVAVHRFVKHRKYKKYFQITKRYKAQDEGNTKKVGEKVSIIEVRPISKGKHFRVLTERSEAQNS